MTGRIYSSKWRYNADDFDDNGFLTVPFWVWIAVTWLLWPWWMTAVAIAQGKSVGILYLIYPEPADNIFPLLCGLPVIAIYLIYPLRGIYPRLAATGYILAMVATLMTMCDLIIRLASIRDGDDTKYLIASLLCFDFAAWLMMFSSRLWDSMGGVNFQRDN